MSAAEVAGGLPVEVAGAGVADRAGQNDVGGQFALLAEDARDNAADMRLNAVGVEVVAGHHPALAVFVGRAGAMVQTADERDFIHPSAPSSESVRKSECRAPRCWSV